MKTWVVAVLTILTGGVALAQTFGPPATYRPPLGGNETIQLIDSGRDTIMTSDILTYVEGNLLLTQYTVATLPACTAALTGALYAVSDATSPTYNGALTGGGAVGVPVYCNGSSWTSH